MISFIPLGTATTKNICMAPYTHGVDEPDADWPPFPASCVAPSTQKPALLAGSMQILMANVTVGYPLLLQALS